MQYYQNCLSFGTYGHPEVISSTVWAPGIGALPAMCRGPSSKDGSSIRYATWYQYLFTYYKVHWSPGLGRRLPSSDPKATEDGQPA